MRATEQSAFRRGDGVPHPFIHVALQHEFSAATISPNGGITPPTAHFFGSFPKPQVVLQQSGFHQLLQIVADSRSGCVRLTYRNPGQVWHKGRVCPSSVRCSDQVMAASSVTKRWQCLTGVSLAPMPPRRSDEIEKASADRNPVCKGAHREEASGPSGLIVAAPTTWGLATGTNLGYSSIRVAWK